MVPPPAPGPTTETYPLPQPLPPEVPAPVVPEATPYMAARPVSGGTLLVLADGRTAAASDADRDQVYLVDLGAGRLRGAVTLNMSDEPGRLVEDAAGRLHVVLRGGGAVVSIDSASGTILARRALCAAPRGIAFDRGTDELHVACAGGELVSIAADPTVTAPRRALTLERDLRDVLVVGDRVLVSSFRSAQVTTVDKEGKTSVTGLPSGPSFGRSSPAVAWRMIAGPDSQPVVLHQRGTLDTIGTFPNAYARGQGCGGIVESVISPVQIGQTTTASGGPIQRSPVAADIALSPDQAEYAVVALGGGDQGNQVVFVGATATAQGGSSFNCRGVDSAPHTPTGDGAVQVEAGALPRPGLYLPPNGQVVAVAYDRRGNVIVQSREPATLQILTQRMDAIPLSSDSRFDAGHQLFHTATATGIACASCHPEGGEDGRVWTFQALGALRTQSLRGGIMNTAPFHWNGDQHDLKALMNDVFGGRMGGGTVVPSRVEALGQWLNQIPRIPVATPADAAPIARGKGLFTSAGCAACHAGRDFTNSVSVNVGTGGDFQVPQLHGLAFRAPYMHNGCARTLRDRFNTSCGGDLRHGSVAMLAPAELDDLIAYLDTL
jgi:mono/diheme cytochrome c family protein